jgi:hypothetical protein
MTLSPDYLAALAGILLSLVFSYTPGLKDKYDALPPTTKRLIMLAALLVAAVGVLAYQCRADGACYAAGWETALTAFIAAAVANQATFALSPK